MQAEGPDVGSILTIWDDVSERESKSVLKGRCILAMRPSAGRELCRQGIRWYLVWKTEVRRKRKSGTVGTKQRKNKEGTTGT